MKVRWVVTLTASAALAFPAPGARLADRVTEVHERLLEDRREALPGLSDPFGVPPVPLVVAEVSGSRFREGMPWKRNVVATVFWVGEQPTQNNPVPNHMSAWDTNWERNFGGYDHPERRDGLLPAGFVPSLNPFYIALPYNDIGRDGRHRAEAAEVIPWFWNRYRGDGISVCKGRWVAIHHEGRVCYAQWEDVGPFDVDHWQYVFGEESPRPNRNKSAGIDVSPAVRDFLKMRSGRPVEWRFVEDYEVPAGPWSQWHGGLTEPPLPRR
jgi:hypothetical protein